MSHSDFKVSTNYFSGTRDIKSEGLELNPQFKRDINSSTGKYDVPTTESTNFVSFEVERCEPNEIKNKVRIINKEFYFIIFVSTF